MPVFISAMAQIAASLGAAICPLCAEGSDVLIKPADDRIIRFKCTLPLCLN